MSTNEKADSSPSGVKKVSVSKRLTLRKEKSQSPGAGRKRALSKSHSLKLDMKKFSRLKKGEQRFNSLVLPEAEESKEETENTSKKSPTSPQEQ